MLEADGPGAATAAAALIDQDHARTSLGPEHAADQPQKVANGPVSPIEPPVSPDSAEPAHLSVAEERAAGGSSEAAPSEDHQEADRPKGRLRSETRLGPDWATDENDVLWWRRETRAGSVAPAWPGTGWKARNAWHTPITDSAAKRGGYSSRIRALSAVVANFEARRRAATPHADIALDGAPGAPVEAT